MQKNVPDETPMILAMPPENTRLIVTLDPNGQLLVEIQRMWCGEWVTFAHASKQGANLLIHRPTPTNE